jgi:hypothetical protein
LFLRLEEGVWGFVYEAGGRDLLDAGLIQGQPPNFLPAACSTTKIKTATTTNAEPVMFFAHTSPLISPPPAPNSQHRKRCSEAWNKVLQFLV